MNIVQPALQINLVCAMYCLGCGVYGMYFGMYIGQLTTRATRDVYCSGWAVIAVAADCKLDRMNRSIIVWWLSVAITCKLGCVLFVICLMWLLLPPIAIWWSVEITCVIFLMKHLLLTIQQVKRSVGLDPKAPINQKREQNSASLNFSDQSSQRKAILKWEGT